MFRSLTTAGSGSNWVPPSDREEEVREVGSDDD